MEAVRVLCTNVQTALFYCRTLHAKLYLVECDGFRCAVLGSPNLTGRADAENKELAIEFRTTVSANDDDVAHLITSLIEYADSLISEDDVKLIERLPT